MSLQETFLTLDPGTLPEGVSAMVDEANRRVDEFYAEDLGRRHPKYVPSDPAMVYAAIACLRSEGNLQGNVFCEWGCGFGIASAIAALLGLTAYGIEIDEALARRATRLAVDLEIPMTILQESYLPEGFEECEGIGGKDLLLPESTTTQGGLVSPPEYGGLDPAEVDLFYVYPWPGEEEMMLDLFTAVASPGAVLLMYQEDGEFVTYCDACPDPFSLPSKML